MKLIGFEHPMIRGASNASIRRFQCLYSSFLHGSCSSLDDPNTKSLQRGTCGNRTWYRTLRPAYNPHTAWCHLPHDTASAYSTTWELPSAHTRCCSPAATRLRRLIGFVRKVMAFAFVVEFSTLNVVDRRRLPFLSTYRSSELLLTVFDQHSA